MFVLFCNIRLFAVLADASNARLRKDFESYGITFTPREIA